MSTCDSVETVSSSPELKEYLTLRKIIKQLESELISAQIYVNAEVNTYYSNIKVIVFLKCYTNFEQTHSLKLRKRTTSVVCSPLS